MDRANEDHEAVVVEQRGAWVKPEIRRIRAGDAESSGATSDDGIIGNS